MKNRKLKTIGAIAVCACIMASQAAMSVSAADGIVVSLNESANTLGYTVRGYYCGSDGNMVEVAAKKRGNEYFFAGEPNNEKYTQFYYDIYDYNGKLVQNKVLGSAGDLFYVEDDFKVVADPDLSFDEIFAADMLNSGASKEEVLNYLNNTTSTTTNNSSNNNTNDSQQTPVDNTNIAVNDPNTIYQEEVTPVTAGVIVHITSDYAIDQLSYSNLHLVLTGADGKQYNADFASVRPTLNKELSIPDGTYSVSVGIDNTFVSTEVFGDTTAVVANGLCELNYKVTPACVLQVIKSGVTDCEFAVVGDVQSKHNVSNGNIGVKPGAIYTITDLSVMKQFNIQIPTNTTLCQLDLATVDGTPVNEAAQSDAVLNETASDDNPYNIPATGDTSNESSPLNTAASIAIVATLVAAATVVKISSKNNK